MAFQLRDDMLGIWAASSQSGKAPAGDLRRKKMSLPVIQALETASPDDRSALQSIYLSGGEATDDEIQMALAVLERTKSREQSSAMARTYGERARAIFGSIASLRDDPTAAQRDLGVLLEFVMDGAR